MKVIIGIILLHMLVIYRAKFTIGDGVPYVTTFFLTLLLVGYVVMMMYIMPMPES